MWSWIFFFLTTGASFRLKALPLGPGWWSLGGHWGCQGGWGAPSGFQGQLGQSLRLLQPVSRASGLLFCPAEPTAFSRRHLIIAAMQPSWRQFREEQGERCGVGGPGAGAGGGGREQSLARLRRLAQRGPAGNLRSEASVRQRLEKRLPSKGRNELAGKMNGGAFGGKGVPPHHGLGVQAQGSTGPSHHPCQAFKCHPTCCHCCYARRDTIPLEWEAKKRGWQIGGSPPFLLMVTLA